SPSNSSCGATLGGTALHREESYSVGHERHIMLSSREEVECSHATGNDGPKRIYQPEPGWCGHFPTQPRPFCIRLDTFMIWHTRGCQHPLSVLVCPRRKDVAHNYLLTSHR